MKALVFSLFFLNLSTAVWACEQDEISFPKNNVCAKLSWINTPALNQYNSASIHTSATELKLNVLPWMVMAGGHEHGSRPAQITTISPNDYLIEKLYFMGGMQGDWFLKLQLLDASKVILEEIRVKVEL